MPQIDPVVLELLVKDQDYKRSMMNSTRMVARELDAQEAKFRRHSSEISSTLKGLAGTLAAGFGAREVAGLIDDYTRLQNALRVAGLEGEQLAKVQERLYALGSQYGVSVNTLADLYGNVAQAGRSLGASQSELLTLTEAVSQSLLITGKSAAEASGATLGLVQALAAGTVRAEEYAQVNEGGLRPLLEAAAATDRFKGDINALRAAVYDGTVSSQEFYRAILDGAQLIEGKAANATITLSGAFQSLNDQLGKYLGEAGQASGATGAMAEAIKALAENLDVIIPALAVIAASMGVRMVASAIAGSNAVFALTAAMGGAATATEALTFALRGLQGVGVVAFLAGLVYVLDQVRQSSLDAAKATGEYAKQQEQLEEVQARAEKATSDLATATGRARVEALANAKALREEARQALFNAKAKAEAARQTARLRAIDAQEEVRKARAVGGPLTRDQFGGTGIAIEGPAQKASQEAQNNLRAANKAVKDAQGVVSELTKSINSLAPVDTSAAGGGKKTKTRTRSGPDAAEIAARQEAEIARLRAEEIQARLQLTEDIDERANLQAELDSIEFAQRRADIESNADLTRAQKDAQLEILGGLFGVSGEIDEQGRIIVRGNEGLYAQIREREAQLEEIRRQGQLDADTARAKEDVLRSQLSITSNREERARLEKQILDIQIQAAKDHLREQIATAELAKGQEKRVALLKQQLADLDGIAANESKAIEEAYESPLQRYARDLNEKSLEDRAEELIVDEIETVRRGMRDAIADAIGTDDPLITGLLDILLQEVLFKPLADSLANARGGGGDFFGSLLSGIGSFFGGARATGGPVSAGKAYLVGERGPELMVPGASGTVIPNHAISAANSPLRGGRGAESVSTIRVELSGDLDARMVKIGADTSVQVYKALEPGTVQKSVGETFRQAQRPRM